MDGYSFGKYFGEAIIALLIAAAALGAVAAIGLSWLIPWVIHQMSL